MAARRPSELSIKSPQSPYANGQIHAITSPSRVETPSTLKKRGTPGRSISAKLPEDNATLDPEEIFTKYTVGEVKLIQARLRTDADAKQEELRQMVGERYRDLLQASTSIIDIAASTKRVMSTLEDTKDAILSRQAPSAPKRMSIRDSGDAHLQTLQILSSHIKLLLDSPEHLWRLIERKKFFPAAWLFLLARVVHRSLVRESEQDDEMWSKEDLQVLDHFPLVQRQWEVVSQFRPQIIHKASVSLKESKIPAEDTCATLLTLHILDSRPLTEVFSMLLSQRTKSLQLTLSWALSSETTSLPNAHGNGSVPEKSKPLGSVFRRNVVREVKDATLSSAASISSTVNALRKIFKGSSHESPLVIRALESIQSHSQDSMSKLPSELQLSSQSLLMTLPSSTQFLLLPQNIRSYRPYVDLSSSSSTFSQSRFLEQLEGWFKTSCEGLKTAMKTWFSDLRSLREVWNIRGSMQKWVESSSDLDGPESLHLRSLFDEVCQHRVIDIWNTTLRDADQIFGTQLSTSLSSLHKNGGTKSIEFSPQEFLFHAPPLPTMSHSSAVPPDSSFQKYQGTLRKQLIGRTAMLENVMLTLEACARALKQDMAFILSSSDENNSDLVRRLSNGYRPEAQNLLSKIVQMLDATIPESVSDSDLPGLLFVGRIANDLSTSSSFIWDLGCEEDIAIDFRKRTKSVHDKIIDRWRTYTVSVLIRDFHFNSSSVPPIHKEKVAAISPPLVKALLSLSISIEDLGLLRDLGQLGMIAEQTLSTFVGDLLHRNETHLTLLDLRFLQKLLQSYVSDNSKTMRALDQRISTFGSKHDTSPAVADTLVSDQLSRIQIMLASLLPQVPDAPPIESSESFAAVLRHGIPSVDQQFQPSLEVAKSSRFGLLLVDTTVVK